jgi:hypothetical protein
MAGILPEEFNLGGTIGKSMATGLSGGLNTIAQFKMNEMMRRQKQNEQSAQYRTALSALLPNLPDEQVGMLSQFGPQLMQMLMHPQGLMSGFMGQNADQGGSPQGAPYNVQVPFAPKGKQTFVTPKSPKKTMAKKALTQKHIDWFLQRAKGDPELATKLAKKAGYAA